MKSFLSKSFLHSEMLVHIWNNFTKTPISSIKPGCVYTVSFINATGSEVQLKNFVGICLGVSGSSSSNQSFILRNFFKIDSVEMTFFYNSPLITSISPLNNYKKKVKFSKLFYLRTLRRKSYKKS